MSKVNHRGHEALRQRRQEVRRAQQELREQEKAQGLVAPPKVVIPNSTSPLKTVEQEREAREAATAEQVRIFRDQLPTLLENFSEIEDPRRDPEDVKHKLTALLLYGILTFVFHRTSRRHANRTLTHAQFVENLNRLFPELESIPHHDTLYRLLRDIDVNKIEAAHLDLIRRFIRNKKFCRYLIENCHPIAIDGSQKLVRDSQWCEETLQREIKKGEDTADQHYVYVLEANLAFHNGMTIPLMSEFLTYPDGDVEDAKQDCEQKAFHRLADRLKGEFSHLPIIALLDGLYPNGPILAHLRKLNWDFMIVLKDGSLPSVWEEVNGLKKLQKENELFRRWYRRHQHFWWVNDIDYSYGDNNRHHQKVHVVVCEESWQVVDRESAEVVTKTSKHVWISSKPLHKDNVHERCNLGARHRWSGIEASFLVEKRQGYQYEHIFAYQWNAMKGYHFLMRLGHMINVLAQYSSSLADVVRTQGVRGFIQFVVETISGPWLNPLTMLERLAAPFQLKLRL
jgi:hypothetical protein